MGSTDPETAKQFQPKKLDATAAAKMESAAAAKGSSWNTGATMEQFDYSEWMKKRLEALLLGVTFPGSAVQISEVVKVEGSATILLIRGKYRPGFDVSFECKWKGYAEVGDAPAPPLAAKAKEEKEDAKQCEGVLKMDEITSEDDPDDWEYEASIKKRSKVNKAGLRVVKQGKEGVLAAIQVFVKELKSKK